LCRRHLSQAMHARRITRLGPITQQHRKIPERITASAHIPVDDRAGSKGGRLEDHIVELEIRMEQARLDIWRCPGAQPCDNFGKRGASDQVGKGWAPGGPALDGSPKETRRTAEGLQAHLPGVYGMQRGEALDQLPTEVCADLRSAGRGCRQSVANDDPRAV